jgi:hypothetical protein
MPSGDGVQLNETMLVAQAVSNRAAAAANP